MPLVDMPLEELYKYKGSTPCPKDFDEYWAGGLAEMNAISDEPQFIKMILPLRESIFSICILREQKMQKYTQNSLSRKMLREQSLPC